MGIRGITALINKNCPQCVRPSSLADFKGKTIAIDGNLLSQRFHHGSYERPLIVSWYRFLMGLRERYEITPICVFDGPTRLPQKDKELAKRQAQRSLTLERAAFESSRSNLVDAFAAALPSIAALPSADRLIVANRFDAVFSPTGGENVQLFEETIEFEPTIEREKVPNTLETKEATQTFTQEPTTLETRETAAILAEEPTNLAESERAKNTGLSQATLDLLATLKDLKSAPSSPETSFSQSPSQNRLSNVQTNLYKSAATILAEEEADSSNLDELSLHLKQLQLDTASLAQKYANRSRSIATKDVEDVQKLIKAMGIPLIMTSEETPHEAEALAATIFNAGIADVVLTEDSDVLLYDASMLRHATGYKVSASIVNGKEVRDALGLDRDAFIDLGLLCGSDFAETIPKLILFYFIERKVDQDRLGPVTALKLIREHGSIEEILQQDAVSPKPKWILPDLDAYLQQISLAREVFHGPPPIPLDLAELRMTDASPELADIIARFTLADEYVPDGAWQSKTADGYFEDGRATLPTI